ncbi:GAF and ANTAR domain-containing protein [Pseudonocardia sp. WMMC193]|uniref:GAF and ANTAR domain-containing protein n=1 Tax=Pseudonocardia sp. WMMC193 TaxID=2911965 RepID=UPI001F01E085|nr:GAF and ANTAR domain-containing protein [Pseudonocardia sp. WMMC193]MCF7549738.1 GAF domain-containing protein [Pseudonocardia sp. WMMC193]
MGLTLEIGRTAVAAADLGPLLQRICATLPGTLGVPAAAIVLVEPPDTRLAGVTASGPDPARLGEMELRAGTGPVQGAVRSGRPMVTPDLTRIGPPELAAAAADTGLTCSVVVPLRVDGEPAGGLQLFGHPGRPVGDGHVDALAGLADVLSARLSDVCAVRRLTGTVARLTAEHEAALPVAHAAGMLAERYRTDPEEAGRFLDSLARKTGTGLADAARAVLSRTDGLDAPTTAIARVPAPRAGHEQPPGPGPRRPVEPRPVEPRPVEPRPWNGRTAGATPPRHQAPEPRGTHPSGDRLAPGRPGPARPVADTPAPPPTGGRRHLREPAPETPAPPPGGRARHRRADIG